MMKKQERIIDGRECLIYGAGSSEALLIQPVDNHDIDVLDSEVSHIEALSPGTGFSLASFRVNEWNSDLSPWEAPPVFGDQAFGSGAEETLKYITESLLPEFEAGTIYLGGYSLAGLFSLWAGYQTDVFAGIAAASPSVWFPGWIDYAADRNVLASDIYLSLGDKEERTRNPVMRTVGDSIRRQLDILDDDPSCRNCILEMNPGNHFRDPDLRTARGFAWLLSI